MKRLIVLLMVACAAGWGFCHGDKSVHADDMLKVFDGYADDNLKAFYERFSSTIDIGANSIEKQVRKCLAERYPDKPIKLTKHRYIAHSWIYGGDIPDLSLIESRYPGCRDDVVAIWRKFNKDSNSFIKSEFGLEYSPWIANAYCAMLYYTHLLGDWDPSDNADFDYLMPPKEIVKHLTKACREMFGRSSHAEYCDRFEETLKGALRSKLGDQQKGVAVMKALWSLKVGTELHETYAGKGLDERMHRWRGNMKRKEP